MSTTTEDEDIQTIVSFCRQQLPGEVDVFVDHDDFGRPRIVATDNEHHVFVAAPMPEHRTDLTIAGTAVKLIKNWAGCKAHAEWNLNGSEQS